MLHQDKGGQGAGFGRARGGGAVQRSSVVVVVVLSAFVCVFGLPVLSARPFVCAFVCHQVAAASLRPPPTNCSSSSSSSSSNDASRSSVGVSLANC